MPCAALCAFFEEIRASIKRGDVGDVVCIQALENVRYWHQAHSYVRGNWRSEKQSAFMLLAKCCHDIDYLVWLCGGRSIRVLGTHGAIEGDMDENIIRIEPFGKPERVINLAQQGSDPAGHGGGDQRMVDELIRMPHEGGMPCGRMTTLEASAESHYIAFAAERSRLCGGMAVEVADLRG